MEQIHRANSFVPDQLLSWIHDGHTDQRFYSAVAFADVSGFTAMSEKLSSIGREGAEILTNILNDYFTLMIDNIRQDGGFVGKFGGDAITIFYPASSEKELRKITARAARNCLRLQSLMPVFGEVKTKVGVFSLAMKIGIASGSVLFKVVGENQPGSREILLAGTPLDEAASSEHHAVAGQVVMTGKSTSKGILRKNNITSSDLDDGYLLISNEKKLRRSRSVPPLPKPHPEWTQIARTFMSPEIYHRIALGMESVGEIRRISVIFMSFSGLDYDIDPDVNQKLSDIYDWVFEITQRYGGSINKVDMGDKGSKMIIIFGAPVAHENNEELAVRCGLELIGGDDHLRELGISQKLGISSGVVFAGEVGAPVRQEYTVMGSVVNLSARMMARSEPGQLLIDRKTHDVIDRKFKFSQPEKVQFKGISHPIMVFEVVDVLEKETKPAATGQKPIIGRLAEISIIEKNVLEVLKSRTKTLIINGEAGTGKTRLAQAVLDLCGSHNFQICAGEALSYGQQVPYLIWISVIRKLMNLPGAGSSEELLKKINFVVKACDPDHLYRTPIVANVLGIECEDNEITEHFDSLLRQENFFDFLVRYIRFLTSKRPLVIFLEDSQWIDKSSISLLTYLLRSLEMCRLFIMYVNRPIDRDDISSDLEEISNSKSTETIRLSDLSIDETQIIAVNHLGVQTIDEELVEFIYKFSNGNPSFIEKLVDNLRSQNKIRILPDSKLKTTRAGVFGILTDIELPDSLASLVMSQLDRLSSQDLLTVKLASVIGQQFEEEVISDSYPVKIEESALRESIKKLQGYEIIKDFKESDRYDYIFKNIVTQEVAYDSLLFAHRREYHRRIGLALEDIHEATLKEWYETLARHFYFSEDNRKAVIYLGKSGDKAYYIYANQSAEDYFTRALERNAKTDNLDERYLLLSMRAKVYSILGKIELQKKDLDERIEIAAKLSNKKMMVDTLNNLARYHHRKSQLNEMKDVINKTTKALEGFNYPAGKVAALSKIGTWYFTQNQFDDALKYYQQSANIAEVTDDPKGLAAAISNRGLTLKRMGKVNDALHDYNRAMELSRSIQDFKQEAVTYGNIGVIHHQQGDLDRALGCYIKAIEIAQSIGSKQIQTYYLGNISTAYQAKGQRKEALKAQQELLDISKITGNKRGQTFALSTIAGSFLEKAEFSKAISHYEQAIEIAERLSMQNRIATLTLNLSVAYHYLGEIEKEIKLLKKVIEITEESKEYPTKDYAHRYLGFVLIDIGELNEAKENFKSSIEISNRIKSKGGIASAKIGLGLLAIQKNNDHSLFEEGLREAVNIGDTENVIRAKVYLAKHLIGKNEPLEETKKLLDSAYEIADSNGLLCDIGVIKSLRKKLSDL